MQPGILINSPLPTAQASFSVWGLLFGALALYVAVRFHRTLRFYSEVGRRAKALRGLPSPPYGLLGIIRDVQGLDGAIHRKCTEWSNAYGAVFKVRLLHFHAVCITDPLIARHVLRSKLLDKMRYAYSFLDPFLAGPNLLTGHTGPHWKAVRKGVAPAFSAGNMKLALEHVIERTAVLSNLLQSLGPDTPVNVTKLLLLESMDVIARVGFEKDLGALESAVAELTGASASDQSSNVSDNVRVMLESTAEVMHRIQHPMQHFLLWKGRARYGHTLLRRWRVLVNELLQFAKSKTLLPGTFARLLLETKDAKTGKPLSDERALPEVAALFFAGIDTSGNTGAWALYVLSQRPDVEAKLAAELDAAGLLVTPTRPNPRQLEWADLGKLTYLQAFLKEILRMYPPVGISQLRVNHNHDLVLAGGKLFIPRGTVLWVPHHAMHNSRHNWVEPDKFMPERWFEQGTEFAKKLPLSPDWYQPGSPSDGLNGLKTGDTPGLVRLESAGAAATTVRAFSVGEDDPYYRDQQNSLPRRYMPFAEGPRNCVGQSLAQITLPATIAMLASRFTFKLADQMGGPEGVTKAEQYTLVVGIKGGMHLQAHPRATA